MSQSFVDPATDCRFGLRWQSAMVALFNTVVAVVLTLMAGEHRDWGVFGRMFVYTQSIGFAIYTIIHLIAWLAGRETGPTARDMALGTVLGAMAGSVIGGLLTGTLEQLLAQNLSGLGTNMLLGMVFGAAISHYFFATFRMAQAQLEIEQRENRQLSAEKELAETRLRLLQAQIEPHFLFNTLSNIHSLIETHPARAARMLEALTDLLRASLDRTRTGRATLGDELALVSAYLEIQRERMGTRLRYTVDVPAELWSLPLPPLMIQPLVENAVQHGIEPAMEGGALTVRASRDGAMLRIEVRDDGRGLAAGDVGHGVGLANVRERLATLFGTRATFELRGGDNGGACAMVALPLPDDGQDGPA